MKHQFHRLCHLVAVGALLIYCPAALASDAADRSILGFSPDGAYFAFEEFGVQDGSGFPYSSLYILDTAKDEWVRGTPVRALLKNDRAKQLDARNLMHRRGDPFLWRLKIGQQGMHILSDPAKKAEEAARFVPFTVPDKGSALGLGSVRLRLNQFAVDATHCAFIDESPAGFSLILEDRNGQPLRILQEDETLPKSRGCALHYGISDVLVYQRSGLGPVLVVMVSVYRFGFEGLDRRFIAISAAFDETPTN